MLSSNGDRGFGGDGPGGSTGPIRLADLRYDYRNQMVEYEDPVTSGGGNLWRFAYDALGRRVLRRGPSGDTAYVHGGQASWQVLEEYYGPTNAALLKASYVYGNYIDEPIVMSRDFDGSNPGTIQHFYFHQHDLFNVVALTASGTHHRPTCDRRGTDRSLLPAPRRRSGPVHRPATDSASAPPRSFSPLPHAASTCPQAASLPRQPIGPTPR